MKTASPRVLPLLTAAMVRPVRAACQSAASVTVLQPSEWKPLRTPPSELSLAFTLPTGQSFRWRKSGDNEYTGVIGPRVVQMRQEPDDVSWRVVGRDTDARAEDDEAALRDYFNLGVNLTKLSRGWAQKDKRFAQVHKHICGARMMRQDPVECVFEFICSSNNHISRIQGMVEYLCSSFGTKLQVAPGVDLGTESEREAFYAFPSIAQLQRATEHDLRQNGFGYRARYIAESARMLHEMPEGGRQWLLSLRDKPAEEAIEELTCLSGVGPKVAACIALFSCDKHSVVPVDTHVWKLATKYYFPSAKGKTLSPKLHPAIMQAFVDVFGEYAGWAHNALFISELAAYKHLINGEVDASSTKELKRRLSSEAVSDSDVVDMKVLKPTIVDSSC